MFRIVRTRTIADLESRLELSELSRDSFAEQIDHLTRKLIDLAESQEEIETLLAKEQLKTVARRDEATKARELLREIAEKVRRFDPEGMILPRRLMAACDRACQFLQATTGASH